MSSLKFLTRDVKIPLRRLFAVMLLFSNTLAAFYIFHYYLLDLMFKQIGADSFYFFVARMLFLSLAVSSGIIGSLIVERVDQRKFLWSWLFFGLLVTVSLVFFVGLEFALFSCAMLGVSMGLGFPTCQAFLTESTTVEERGRVAGIAIFVAFAAVVLSFVLADSFNMGLSSLIWAIILLKATSFLALKIDPCRREKGPTLPWLSVVVSKGFLSFALPWLIFHLANGILVFGSLSSEFANVEALGSTVELFGTILTVVVAGFAADFFGRKQPLLVGLIMLGISYIFFGLVATPESYFIYLIVEGVAWGLIAVTYMQVILGDLSAASGSKEKFFVLGGIMIPLLTFQIFSLVQDWSKLTVPASTLSRFLSIAILLSVVPVFRASETLPESKMRERKLKQHVEKVRKLVEESRKGE